MRIVCLIVIVVDSPLVVFVYSVTASTPSWSGDEELTLVLACNSPEQCPFRQTNIMVEKMITFKNLKI